MRVDYGVKVKGLDEVLDKLDAIDNVHKDEAFEMGLATGAAVVIEEARRRVPAKSGHLRDSLHVGGHTELTPAYRKPRRFGPLQKPQGQGRTVLVYLGSALPYAHLVERGTQTATAKPYLRRAVDEKQKEIVATVDKTMQEIIDRA